MAAGGAPGRRYDHPVIRATFELAPSGSAGVLARRLTTGLPADRPELAAVAGRVVAEHPAPGYPAPHGDPGQAENPGQAEDPGQATGHGDLAVLEFPASNWGENVPLLVSTLVAGEVTEMRAFTHCRLVGLELPDGLLPGPALGADPAKIRTEVGLIVKPQLGLRPDEFAAVARAGIAAGADLIKDDEVLGDPPSCRLEDRVRAMAEILPPGVVYCPNLTGPSATLLERAARVVELGASGLMVNAFAQGVDSILALRRADLGVPILAHRAGSGPYARNPHFGASGAVLARLTRLCGADHVIVGAFAGSLFDDHRSIEENLAAVRDPCGPARPSVAVLGGGLSPGNAAAQAARAGGSGLMVLLGTAAYEHPGGVGEAVAATVAALA
ncbi:MAG: 3-oxoisoapionate-4-phosphate transcarboxylase/hydrolase [Solirubrobacteraceae bacterium]|jgi:ribulose 1,5-bisphosphate carboxylase large subunit-like protein|nr:3-oxoisoapionate-4-phosphate transcarboxylase/hydrolase [Solirubrobacteraceae bacterium]